MNASAAEWRPGGPYHLQDDSARSKFHHFSSLSEDLAVLTLSFVGDVPFETDETDYRSSLTHIIPLVSKQFHELVSRSDVLWKNGLTRLVKNEPYVWREGVRKLVVSDEQTISNASNGRERRHVAVGTTNIGERVFVGTERASPSEEAADDDDDEGDDSSASSTADVGTPAGFNTPETMAEASIDFLIDYACRSVSVDGIASNCQRLFREVLSRHVKFTGPIFCKYYIHLVAAATIFPIYVAAC